MKKSLFVMFALSLLFLVPLSTLAQGGIVVPIEPCAITYATALTANTPLHLQVRGYGSCGVPTDAIAVFVNMKAGGSATSGKIYLWPYDDTIPSTSQFNYDPNVTPGAPHSDQALVRLSAEYEYGEEDLTVQSTTNCAFSLMVEGYIVPLP